MVDDTPALEKMAREFAQELTGTVHAVSPECAPFTATLVADGPRVSIRQSPRDGIPLYVNGSPWLTLKVNYQCCLDGDGRYLAVDAS